MNGKLIEILEVCHDAVEHIEGVEDVTFDCDNDSAEVIFTVEGEDYVLKAKELE